MRFRSLANIRSPAAALALALLTPATAGAAERIQALLVGVDHYKYAGPASGVEALDGPSHDVDDMKKALCAGYRICAPRVLLDAQATRSAILAALWSEVDAMTRVGKPAPPGSTLIFYYSGHGGQYEDTVGDQAGAPESTLVPYDGRGPDAVPDVLGRELNIIIKEANLRGVNVVTIFDSCNSGTATRGFEEVRIRRAPLAKGPPPPAGRPHVMPSAYAKVPGYRVHLAAAPDGEAALEVKIDGVWRGLFTAALTSAIGQEPHGVTYRDLMAAAELKLSQIGAPQQIWLGHDIPTGKTGLTADPLTDVVSDHDLDAAFLGAAKSTAAVYEAFATADPTLLKIDGGRLTGVTEGSVFDVFAGRDEALDTAARPLAEGAVQTSGVAVASLKLIHPAAKSAAGSYFLREIKHDYGVQTLKVAIMAPTELEKTQLVNFLKPYKAVEVVTDQPQIVLRKDGDVIHFEAENGTHLADAHIHGSAHGASDVFLDLAKFSKFFGLLSLKDAGKPGVVTARFSKVNCQGVKTFDFALDGAAPVLKPGDPFYIRFFRGADASPDLAYIEILDLGPDFSIVSFFGDKLGPDQCSVVPFNANNVAGVNYVLILTTDRPIDVGALRQDGVRSAPPPGASPLEQLLANANPWSRSAAPPVDVGAWGATVLTFRTAKEDAK